MEIAITQKSNNIITVLAFDPGIGMMGWCVIQFDLSDGTTKVVAKGLLTGQHLLKERKELQNKFSKSFIILEVYYEIFCQLIEDHKPDFVVTEGAFYHKFAQTYASLSLVIHTLRRACRIKLGIDLYEVAPMETKKEITGNHMADKNQIKQALLTRPGLTIKESPTASLDDVSEHEYDAIGHGLTFISKDLPTVLASGTLS